MGATVYASAAEHAEVYHFDTKCTHFHSAQLLNDWDCGCVIYCTHTRPRRWPLKRMSDDYATVNRRLWPCRYCVPPHLKKFPPSETFGHEVFTYDGVPCCIRCFTENRGQRNLVPWPCTSAIVLVLVPRSEQ